MTDNSLHHPDYTNYELHHLPHERVYDKERNIYLPITTSKDKTTISILVTRSKKIELARFKLECKLKRSIKPNETIVYNDQDKNNCSINNLSVKQSSEEKAKPKKVYVKVSIVDDNMPPQYYKLSEAVKSTLISKPLIIACCEKQIDKVKGKEDNKWYIFSYAEHALENKLSNLSLS